jgi:hypothetical protein
MNMHILREKNSIEQFALFPLFMRTLPINYAFHGGNENTQNQSRQQN